MSLPLPLFLPSPCPRTPSPSSSSLIHPSTSSFLLHPSHCLSAFIRSFHYSLPSAPLECSKPHVHARAHTHTHMQGQCGTISRQPQPYLTSVNAAYWFMHTESRRLCVHAPSCSPFFQCHVPVSPPRVPFQYVHECPPPTPPTRPLSSGVIEMERVSPGFSSACGEEGRNTHEKKKPKKKRDGRLQRRTGTHRWGKGSTAIGRHLHRVLSLVLSLSLSGSRSE